MVLCFNNAGKTLEDKLLKQSFCLGVLVVFLLSLYDFFYTHEYDSVILEVTAAAFFVAMILTTRNREASFIHTMLFSLFIVIIVNVAWLISKGVSIINTGVFFLVWSVVLIISDSKYHRTLYVIIFFNLLLLFLWQSLIAEDLAPDEIASADITRKYITSLIFMIFGLYLIEYLKNSYNSEREKLRQANRQLQGKTEEIEAQNEELKAFTEQMDFANTKLEKQKKELIEIKNTLEQKVEKRTEHLKKSNQKLIAQNQQLEQYAFITSHNLRAPIAQIKGLVKILDIESNSKEMNHEILNCLEKSTDQLQQVVDDLGVILRVKQDLHQAWQEVDIIAEIESVVRSLKEVITKKDIEIKMPAVKHLATKGIRVYVYSILQNLIENAVKYSDPAKDSFIKIDIDELPEYHKVSVIDNGIGMDMEVASEKIFQMYQRFTDSHPGQGFGLFLVKTQIEAMDGKIEVESVYGQGTAFHLYFSKQH